LVLPEFPVFVDSQGLLDPPAIKGHKETSDPQDQEVSQDLKDKPAHWVSLVLQGDLVL